MPNLFIVFAVGLALYSIFWAIVPKPLNRTQFALLLISGAAGGVFYAFMASESVEIGIARMLTTLGSDLVAYYLIKEFIPYISNRIRPNEIKRKNDTFTFDGTELYIVDDQDPDKQKRQ